MSTIKTAPSINTLQAALKMATLSPTPSSAALWVAPRQFAPRRSHILLRLRILILRAHKFCVSLKDARIQIFPGERRWVDVQHS
ncbi:hypothetical protein H0484_03900 [Pusillimonas sp. CC-YST705]|uniref:Uncharacterized protein n=1 Tax=Mesopusillimonas faecipullorum TaxID=2755040 RepID=A0ABS8CA39_9BURK|nr:hypothetical protein [Mesopusillimonas faecipullorum]MCB5362898.1 hypothetical protein [Mesopusillimonas faecipullorum]